MLFGLVSLSAFLAHVLWVWRTKPEKNAHYYLGHWFDGVWAVEVPLLIIGVLALAGSFFLKGDKSGSAS